MNDMVVVATVVLAYQKVFASALPVVEQVMVAQVVVPPCLVYQLV